MGLELFVQNPEDRLPTVTTVKVPEGVNWKDVASHMMHKVRESSKRRDPPVSHLSSQRSLTHGSLLRSVCAPQHKIEISGGLGPTAGKVFRIGIMGYNAGPQQVNRLLSALKEALDLYGQPKGEL